MNRPPLLTAYCLLLTAFLSHALFYFFALGADAVDDAYISFRYAHNAILGYGLVFNPGERVEGFTNFLWTALMVPLEGASVDVGRASMFLGALLGLGMLWLVVRFANSTGVSPAVGFLAALLLAADGSFALWAVSGLETPLFAFLLFAGALLYVREQDDEGRKTKDGLDSSFVFRLSSHFPLSGFLFALAAMTRPEGSMVFAVTVAHQAAWRIWNEHRLFSLKDVGRVGGFAALFVPYWLGRWWYYHSFLPNSFHAKVSPSGSEAQWLRGWRYLQQFLGVHLGWLVLVPPCAAVGKTMWGRGDIHKQSPTRPRSFWTSYFAAIILAYSGYIVYVGGDWSVGRFFVPLLAPFYLLFSTGVVDMWNWLGDKQRTRGSRVQMVGITASLLLVASVFVASSWNGEYGLFIREFDAARATTARTLMGKWLKANVPRGTLIAVDAAGQVPYFSGLPAVDMFGINDLYIGRLPVASLGKGTPGHEKFDLGYVLGRAPQYVVIYGTLLDSVSQYERAPVKWTDDPEMVRFLTLYVRRAQ